MPRTTFQKYVFMTLTVLLSVTAFTIYNVAIAMGSMSNRVFLPALREIPLEAPIAFLLEATLFHRMAQHMAFRYANPREDRPVVVVLAITACTICLMCPAMSLVATAIHTGVDAELPARWLQRVAWNFPFAFFTQIFLIGPTVRVICRSLFRPGPIRA